MPQGAVLSPKLYTMYVADIPTSDNAAIYVFADDTAILAAAKQKRSVSTKLEKSYQAISRYYDKWHITINPDKTDFVIFPPDRKKRRVTGRNPKLTGIEIHPSACTRYLGVLFDSKLSFLPHVNKQKSKIIAICSHLYPALRGTQLNDHSRRLIVKQILWPTISYAMPAWASTSKSNIKSLRQKFSALARSVLKLPRRHATDDLYKQLKMQLPDEIALDCRRSLIDVLNSKGIDNLTTLATYLEDTWPPI